MIEFETLFIRNFLSVASADVLLDKQGLVLIEGINQDDPSAKSNGAGKSSIVDAISWCLFGQTARGVTGDAVVNIKAGKETMVRVVVIVDGRRYRITRSRKHSKYKNRVELDEIVGADITSLTLGTDKLTQERINNLLGCTPDIFNASIYMGQEAMPDLPGMTDKQLKGILEQAMSLDKLDDALEVCKDRLATAQHEADSATSKLKMIADEIVVAENMVDKYTTMLRTDQSELTDARQELIDAKRDYAAKRADLNVRLKAKEDTLSKMDRVTMKEIMDEGKKADQAYWNIHVAPLIEKRGKAERLLDQNAADLRQTRREIDQLEQGGACPTCGHTTEADPEHRTAEMTKLKDQLSDLTAKRQRLGDALNQIARDLSTEQKTSAKVGDDHAALLMDKHSARLTVEREIDVLLTDVKHLEAFHKSAAATLEKIVATKERLCDQHQKDIDDQLADISDLKASHRKITVDAAAATERVGVLTKVKHILGRKGFRGEVLDQITPYLNARTQHYLGQLTDDNITATWNTVSENAAGDYVETFHIDVAHTSGVTKFAALSGGEKRKVRLACALALQDLVGTRAVKPIKLFVADEIDDAIDEAGLELLMGLLEQKAKEVGTVFVISHNDIGDWVRNKITVIKKDGQSNFVRPTI